MGAEEGVEGDDVLEGDIKEGSAGEEEGTALAVHVDEGVGDGEDGEEARAEGAGVELRAKGEGGDGGGAVEEEGEGEAAGVERGAGHEEVEAEGSKRGGGKWRLGVGADGGIEKGKEKGGRESGTREVAHDVSVDLVELGEGNRGRRTEDGGQAIDIGGSGDGEGGCRWDRRREVGGRHLDVKRRRKAEKGRGRRERLTLIVAVIIKRETSWVGVGSPQFPHT